MLPYDALRLCGDGNIIASALKLLMNFEGANGSTTFIDESPLNRTATATGTAAISTAQAARGSSSLAVTGGALNGVALSDRAISANVDFTIDLYFRATTLNASFFRSPIGSYTSSTNNTWCLWAKNTPSSVLLFQVYNGLGLQGTTVIGLNTWYFARICRSGDTLRIFLGTAASGTAALEAKATGWGSQVVGVNGAPFYVGKNNAGFQDTWDGHVDRVAILEGLALSTSDASVSLPVLLY